MSTETNTAPEVKPAIPSGAELIAEERARQISAEGWTPEHDDSHSHREIARAAHAYVAHYVERAWIWSNELGVPAMNAGPAAYRKMDREDEDRWPWRKKDWKPEDPVKTLVKAGALIAAEIDRVQRISATTKETAAHV